MALGALLYPALKEANYPERFSLGLVTTSGSLGLLFAPALPLILYGVVAQQMNLADPVKIDDLFLAGLIPGLLMLALLSVYSMWKARGVTQEVHSLFLQRSLVFDLRSGLGNSLASYRTRRHLRRILCSLGSRGGDRDLRADRGGRNSSRDSAP